MTETQLRQKYTQGLLALEGKCAEGGSNSETFSVVSGTTWAEWIGTVRLIFNNSLELYIYGGRVTTEAGVYAVSLDGSTAVYGSDEIVSGATYTIINWGG